MEEKSVTILEAYIPIDRRQALASGQPLPEVGNGAVLFADISGFTRLTGDLAREFGDQRGADEITRYLNLIYHVLITWIHQYRGSVISFAGDAITCWFDGDDGLRALAAGNGMKTAVAELISEHQLPVQIKIVITAGPTHRFTVGDPDIQLLDMLAGETVSQVTAAEKLLKPGEMLVSREVADRFQNFMSLGKPLATAGGDEFIRVSAFTAKVAPEPWVEEARLPDEILSQWLLSPVYEKIRHGEERFLAELRLTVNLFLKFEGIDYDGDPDSGSKINRFICWVQSCVARHDGHLLQVIIGDKGDYLFIGFGALSAHEDDASRAIAAASLLREPPGYLSFISGIRIGITQGRMLAGPYGSPSRRTYSMLGSSANLAARLMEKAEAGQILLAERVAIAAQKQFLFDPLGAFSFKGIDGVVAVFALLGSRDETRHLRLNQMPMVGRLREMEEVYVYAGDLYQNKNTGIILLTGEGGIGKTRLLSELMRQIHGQDITVLSSFAYEIENSTPYFGIRELFGQLFRADQRTPAELHQNLSALVAGIHPEWQRLLPLLTGILPLELPDNELTAQMYGDIRAGNLHTLLTGIFKMMAQAKAVLIILDDAHWLDAASWALLKELKEAVPPLGLIISYRPFTAGPPSGFLKITGNSPCTEITLTNFHRPDIEKLVCQVVGADNLPQEVLSLIYEKTAGHPFFSEELAYALVASGMMVIEEGQGRLIRNLQELEEVTVPDTIQSAITSRLDRMTLPQQLTLKVASILGRLFLIRALRGIHPSPPDNPVLMQEVDAMTGMNLIALQVVEPELAYSFKQNIIHEVAYTLLSFNQRRELHEKAALWYENTFANNLSQYYPVLGYHWQQAEVVGKAVDYLEKAAFDAIARGAYRDGIVFLKQTLALETEAGMTPKRKAVLLIEMGIAFFKTGELEQATGWLKSGLRTLRYPAPSSLAAMGFNLMRQSTRQFVHRLRARPPVSPTGPERQLRLTISRAYEYLAQSYFHHNKLFHSLDAGLSGLNTAESAGPSAQLARAYASLCITSGTMPIPGLSDTYARLAQSLLSAEMRLDDHGRIMELLAVARSGKGHWEEVEQLCSVALGMANEIGDRFLMMENTCILAACLLPQGKLAESVRLRGELYQIGLQDKVELVQGWALLQRAEIALMNHEYTAMHELLVEASDVEHALGQPDRLWLHGLHAGAYTRLGDPLSALKSARKALALARQSLPTSFFVLEGYSGMMTAFMDLHAVRPRDRKIRNQTRQALGAFGKYAGSFPIGRPRFLFWKGRLAMVEGHPRKALKYWNTGLVRANELQMVYEAERLREALGK
jgi:class 3 adenylate cyclase/tetratricopeptide (TPR) repeat protein